MEGTLSKPGEVSIQIQVLEEDQENITKDEEVPLKLMGKDEGVLHDVSETETQLDVSDYNDSDGQFQMQDVCIEQPRRRGIRSSWKDEISTEFPPIKERLKFDGIVAYQYLSPYLLNLEQEGRIVTNKEENEWFITRKKLTQRQVVKYILNYSHTTKTLAVAQLMDCIGDYLKNEGDEFFRGGELSMCGSVAEGTKVSSCDEFDYQYLITLDDYEAVRKPLLRTKPRSDKVETKSFFSLKVMKENEMMELNSYEIHDQFLEQVGEGLVKYFHSTNPLYDLITKKLVKAGPAVKIVLWSETDFVKIDLTFGIKSDPLKLFKEEEMTDLARSLPWDITLESHFICAHDYWKVSFVDTEQQLMRQISQRDPYKAACYRVIKSIRDEVDVKDQYGDGILPSYPIKITFMDLALQDSIKDDLWSMEDTSLHAINVLEEVQRRGQSHQLNDLFLKGEEVISESDRSYLESQRILKALQNAGDVYNSQENYLFIGMVSLYLSSYLISFCFFGVVSFGDIFERSNYATFIQSKQSIFFLINAVLTFSPRKIAAFMHLYTIYPSISQFQNIYACANAIIIVVLIVGGVLFGIFGQGYLYIFQLFWVIVSQVMCLSPVIVFLVSIIINAKRSICLRKNVALFNSHLSISWQWTDPTHQSHPYIPELYGSRGFTNVDKLRAYIVLIITSTVVSLTLLSSILELALFLNKPLGIVSVDLGIEKGPLFGIFLLNILLMFILRLLLNHQVQYVNPESYQNRNVSYGYFFDFFCCCICCCKASDRGFHSPVNYILTKFGDVISKEQIKDEPEAFVNRY